MQIVPRPVADSPAVESDDGFMGWPYQTMGEYRAIKFVVKRVDPRTGLIYV